MASQVKFFVVENVIYDYNVSNLLYAASAARPPSLPRRIAEDMVSQFYYFNPSANYGDQDEQTLTRTYLKNPDVKPIVPETESRRYIVFNKFGLAAWLKDTQEFGPMHRIATMLTTGMFSPQQLVYASTLYGANYIIVNPVTYNQLINSVFGFNAWFVVHARYPQWASYYLDLSLKSSSSKKEGVRRQTIVASSGQAEFKVLPDDDLLDRVRVAHSNGFVTDAGTFYGDVFSSGNWEFLFDLERGENLRGREPISRPPDLSRALRQALVDKYLNDEYRMGSVPIDALASTLSPLQSQAVFRFVELGERFLRPPIPGERRCEHFQKVAKFKKTCRLSDIRTLLSPPREGMIYCKKCNDPMVCMHWLDACGDRGSDSYVHFYSKDTRVAVCKYCGEGLEGHVKPEDDIEMERLIIGFDESTSGVLNEMYTALRKVSGYVYNMKSIVYNALPIIKYYVDTEFNNNKFVEISEQVLYTVISYCYIYATFKDDMAMRPSSKKISGGASIRSILQSKKQITPDERSESSSSMSEIMKTTTQRAPPSRASVNSTALSELMKAIRSVIFSKLVKDKNIQKFLNDRIEFYYTLFRNKAIYSQITEISNSELVNMNLVDSVSFRNGILEYVSFIRFVLVGERSVTMADLLGATVSADDAQDTQAISAFSTVSEIRIDAIAVPENRLSEETRKLVADYNTWVGHFHSSLPVILSSSSGEHMSRNAYYSNLQGMAADRPGPADDRPTSVSDDACSRLAYVVGSDGEHMHVWKLALDDANTTTTITCSVCGADITTVTRGKAPKILVEKLLSEYHITEMGPSPHLDIVSSTDLRTPPTESGPTEGVLQSSADARTQHWAVPLPGNGNDDDNDSETYRFISLVEKELNTPSEQILSIGFGDGDVSPAGNATECSYIQINTLYAVYNHIMSVLSTAIQSTVNKKDVHEKMQMVRRVWNSNKNTLTESKRLYYWLVDVLCETVLFYEKDIISIRRFFSVPEASGPTAFSTAKAAPNSVVGLMVDSSQSMLTESADVFDENANLITID